MRIYQVGNYWPEAKAVLLVSSAGAIGDRIRAQYRRMPDDIRNDVLKFDLYGWPANFEANWWLSFETRTLFRHKVEGGSEPAGAIICAMDVPLPTQDPRTPVQLIPIAVHDTGFIGVALYLDRVLAIESDRLGPATQEEAQLALRRYLAAERHALESLRREVEAMEKAPVENEFERTRIPDAVRLKVFLRDKGSCVRCGANLELQFDHIIPVSKGGSNTEANIQVLCAPCNLKKSDHIATPEM